jgi:hypothetical protein
LVGLGPRADPKKNIKQFKDRQIGGRLFNLDLIYMLLFFFRKNQYDFINNGSEHKSSYNHRICSSARL